MKIILLKDVNKLGALGDIVFVNSGYARNYLFLNNSAVIYNINNYNFIKKQKINVDEKKKFLLEQANNRFQKLSCLSLFLEVRSTKEGKLYGSVSCFDLMLEIINLGYSISADEILLDFPIKEVGEYNLKLKLKYLEKVFSIKLIIKSK